MSYSVSTTPEAQIEVDEIFEYLEAQQTGLGSRFLSELREKFSSLKNHSEMAEEIRPNRRRLVVKPFRYNIIYMVNHEKKNVLIVS